MDVERERIPEAVERERIADPEAVERELESGVLEAPANLEQWLEAQRRRLESLRASIENEVFGESQGGSTGELTMVDQHPADTADSLEAREITVAVEGMLDQRRRRVEAALEKLRRGDYGICDRCGERINPERLAARPDAVYCIDCQRFLEKQRPAA